MTVMSMPSVSIKMKDGIVSASQDLQATEKLAKVYMYRGNNKVAIIALCPYALL